MPSSKTPSVSFNAPAIRARLAAARQYLAHPLAREFVKWKPLVAGASQLLDTENKLDDGSPAPAFLTLVAVVSNDRLQVDGLGAWTDRFKKPVTDAKLKISLVKPTGFVDFEEDWDSAVKAIKELQDEAVVRGDDRSWFVLDDGESLRFTHSVFQEKENLPDESDLVHEDEILAYDEAKKEAAIHDKISAEYAVNENHKDAVETALATHRIVPLAAFDRNNAPIAPKDLSKTLRGALVEITFHLRYHFMKASEKVRATDSNTFVADMVQICVLKNALASSPTRPKGPIRFPAADPRPEQVAAVKAFMMPKSPTSSPVSAAAGKRKRDEPDGQGSSPSKKAK